MRKVIETRAKPALVALYEQAVRNTCRRLIRVPHKDYNKFISRMRVLDKMGVSYDRYAQMVVKTWWGFCQSRRIPYVTVGLFLGEKALARFRAQLDKDVVLNTSGETGWSENVHKELEFARYYICWHLENRKKMTARELRKSIGIAAPDPQVTKEALSLLCALYDCEASNYDGIVQVIQETGSK